MKFHKYKWVYDDSAKFTQENPILDKNTIGVEKDTNKHKVGNGIDPWNDLKYVYGDSNGGDGSIVVEEDINVVGVTVGNYKNGDVIQKGKTFTEVLKEMMQKQVAPTYTAPTCRITASSSLAEMNTTVSITIVPTFNKNDAGAITKYELFKDGASIHTNATPDSYVDTFTISGNVSYTAKFTYADGSVKNDNFGKPYPNGHIVAGTITSAAATVKAIYPIYYGAVDNVPVSEAGLTKDVSAKGNKSYLFSGIDKYCCILYPQTYGNLTSIIDPNGFDCIEGFAKSVLMINGTGYIMYCTNDSASIDAFKYNFNF